MTQRQPILLLTSREYIVTWIILQSSQIRESSFLKRTAAFMV